MNVNWADEELDISSINENVYNYINIPKSVHLTVPPPTPSSSPTPIPQFFKTKMCRYGTDCIKQNCSFAHCKGELRRPSELVIPQNFKNVPCQPSPSPEIIVNIIQPSSSKL